MNDHFESLDAAVSAIRADCETKLKAMSDKLMAAEIRSALAEDQLNRAVQAKEDAIQVASRLIEQFSVAEDAFAKAKKYALTFEPRPQPVADHPLLPAVEP